MDKLQLNREIILCRAVVKRARVCVVRKLLKQIKILRSCKNEEFREKKLRKARRLVAEIHAMKLLQPDYITKFALLTENYVYKGSNTKLKRKRNACAKIAKHKNLMAKINGIRNKLIDWRKELPILLETPKKKRTENGVPDKVVIMDGDKVNEVKEESKTCSVENNLDASVEEEEICDGEVSKRLIEEEEYDNENRHDENPEFPKPNVNKSLSTSEVPKINHVRTVLKTDLKQKKKIEKNDLSPVKEKKTNEEKATEDEEKIDDPFFIGKKITVPKLLQKGNENHPENEGLRKRELDEDLEQELRPWKKRNVKSETEEVRERKGKRMEKVCPRRRQQPLAEDELHPSWKAKKMQTLKPFQGKKIIFQ